MSASAASVPATSAAATASAQQQKSPLQSAIVRSVLTGDTLVVRPKGVSAPQDIAEKTLHIAGIAAPRVGSRDREDEPQAFPSREFLRLLLVGREIRYRVEYTVPTQGAGQAREFCHVYLPPKGAGQPDTNVAHEVISSGWARVHDSNALRRPGGLQPEEEEEGGWKAVMRSVQEEAQAAQRGLWGPDELLKVDYTMPETAEFLKEWRGKPIDAVVEQVRDGSLLRARLLLGPRRHQIINLHLAGVKAPRLAGAGGPAMQGGKAPDAGSSEPHAEEAKFFVESRLLQRNITVTLLSAPQPTATPVPFASTTSAAAPPPPTTAAVLIGKAVHPVGDIAQFLLAAGLARCVDWHAGMLARHGGMEPYRQVERVAKEKRLNIWSSYVPPAPSGPTAAGAPGNAARSGPFTAIVARIVSGDTLSVRRVDESGEPTGPEERIQFSSIRQPQTKDPKQAGYVAEAREFLRRRLIGKQVVVQLDYVKTNEGGHDETRRYATIRQAGKPESNIAEALLERGLASVQRHRRDDEDRSPEFDRLVAAEQKALGESKGVHSGQESPAPRIADASENVGRANSFLPGLKRAGRVAAVVDFVSSAGRLRVIVPRESARLNLVLAGVRAPRTARNPSDKSEPFGAEALDYVTRRALQRDVEIEVTGTDKTGAFIGTLWVDKTDDIAVALVEQGYAKVHSYSADGLSNGAQLHAAEERAKAAKRNVWSDYDANAEAALEAAHNGAFNGSAPVAAAAQQYIDVVVSDVRGDGSAEQPFGFAIQILDEGTKELEVLMGELATALKSAPPPGPGFTPRGGDVVAARFSQDGAWYRAQVKRAQPHAKKAEVRYIDYGNSETLSWSELRPLDATRLGLRRLPAQAHEARLSFIKLFSGKQTEYVTEAIERFRDIAEGRTLIANVELRALERPIGAPAGATPQTLLHLTLYDPSDPNALAAPENCMNVELVADGHARPDPRVAYWDAHPAMRKALKDAENEARTRHRGMYEFGDPNDD